MSLTLREIAEQIGGQLHGDGDTHISGAATLLDCREGEITFVSKPRLLRALSKVPAAAVLVAPDIVPEGISYVVVADVQKAFTELVLRFRPPRERVPVGVSPLAAISPTASIGAGVDVHPYATVGDDVQIGAGSVIHSGARLGPGCRIGAQVEIFPNAVLYENTVVGDRSIIHAGAVLGAYGFGYDSTSRGHRLCSQLGNVELGCDVEIGACATVDRGAYGPTRIGDGTKLDNLVMVAHNCQIGRHNLLCAQVGLAGSCTTGDFVVMAGQAGVRDHLTIGHNATLGAKAGVMGHVKPKVTVVGIPATDVREQMNRQAALARMPEVRQQVKDHDRLIRELLERLARLEGNGLTLYQGDEEPSEAAPPEEAKRAA